MKQREFSEKEYKSHRQTIDTGYFCAGDNLYVVMGYHSDALLIIQLASGDTEFSVSEGRRLR
jgi:hypothetical protein